LVPHALVVWALYRFEFIISLHFASIHTSKFGSFSFNLIKGFRFECSCLHRFRKQFK
jgi:hypothetical protein